MGGGKHTMVGKLSREKLTSRQGNKERKEEEKIVPQSSARTCPQ
jgi:hypothetical protein